MLKKEICGDGINLGKHQCDDGNLKNGDGCDSNCNIEPGFTCFKRSGQPDICKDIDPPLAYLTVLKSNQLEITFSEDIVSIVDSISFYYNTYFIGDELEKSLLFEIQNIQETNCALEYKIFPKFKSYSLLNSINIQTKIYCNIKGTQETIFINITQPHLISDLSQNYLATNYVQARAVKSLYISQEEVQAIEAVGGILSWSSLFMLILMVVINILQSFAIGMFWTFVNMLQVLLYLPIINTDIPSNTDLFLTKYMSACKVVFPFKLIPGFNELLAKVLFAFKTDPVNSKFQNNGFESRSFIYNFADELLTWILLIIIYILIQFGVNKFPLYFLQFITK